jgi:hypothetical protein
MDGTTNMPQSSQIIHCNYRIKSSESYMGWVMNGIPHGFGKMKQINKNRSVFDLFEGNFKNGIKDGYCKATFGNESKYNGNWLNDHKHGRGEMIYVNNDIYNGEWTKDKKSGQGVMKYASGSVYSGEWRKDKCHGFGELQCANGSICEGEWCNGEAKFVT